MHSSAYEECRQLKADLTHRILCYVNEDAPVICHEEHPLVLVDKRQKRKSNKFNLLAFLFDLLTLGIFHLPLYR